MADSIQCHAASSENLYSVRCEAGGRDSSKTVDSNGCTELIGLPPRSTGAQSRPRIARRPPLPIDRRTLSLQGGTGGRPAAAAGDRGRGTAASSRHGWRSTVSSVSGVDADMRQLIDEVRRPLALRKRPNINVVDSVARGLGHA